MIYNTKPLTGSNLYFSGFLLFGHAMVIYILKSSILMNANKYILQNEL